MPLLSVPFKQKNRRLLFVKNVPETKLRIKFKNSTNQLCNCFITEKAFCPILIEGKINLLTSPLLLYLSYLQLFFLECLFQHLLIQYLHLHFLFLQTPPILVPVYFPLQLA